MALSVAALAMLLGTPLLAADMALKAPSAAAANNWTGCYIGANVGWIGSRDHVTLAPSGTYLNPPGILAPPELQAMRTLIASIERRIIAHHRLDEASKRLRSIPGIGLVGATAIAATITDPKAFRSGRDLAAWIGLVPRQDSTGGKQKLGPISKQGDRYLRRILVVGAHAVLKLVRQKPEKYPWLTQLLARKPFKVVAIALANKMARIAWALLVKGGPYRARALVAAA